jgi:hypothetical protein
MVGFGDEMTISGLLEDSRSAENWQMLKEVRWLFG